LDSRWKFKYSKKYLAGAGTQTAGLAFGGLQQQLSLQQLQKNITDQLGQILQI
jgi:hypothetical protein